MFGSKIDAPWPIPIEKKNKPKNVAIELFSGNQVEMQFHFIAHHQPSEQIC